MGQVTWRASDELIAQVKAVAASEGRSLNEFLTHLTTAVVDPDTADGEMASLRERLARAGLLVTPTPVAARPDPIAVAEARRELGRSGVLASELVSEGRG